jgi:hypothetical protein
MNAYRSNRGHRTAVMATVVNLCAALAVLDREFCAISPIVLHLNACEAIATLMFWEKNIGLENSYA